jgi:hypothetical protein
VRSRTSPSTFARSRAAGTPRGRPPRVPRPGVEPGPAPSEGAMMSVSPPGHSDPGAGIEPALAGSGPAVLPLDDPGVRAAEGEGVEPSRALRPRPPSKRVPSPVGSPFRVVVPHAPHVLGRGGVVTAIRQSGRLDLNQRSRASKARDHSGLVHVPGRQPYESPKHVNVVAGYKPDVCRLGPLGTVARAPGGGRTRTSAVGGRQAAAYITDASRRSGLSRSGGRQTRGPFPRHRVDPGTGRRFGGAWSFSPAERRVAG